MITGLILALIDIIKGLRNARRPRVYDACLMAKQCRAYDQDSIKCNEQTQEEQARNMGCYEK